MPSNGSHTHRPQHIPQRSRSDVSCTRNPRPSARGGAVRPPKIRCARRHVARLYRNHNPGRARATLPQLQARALQLAPRHAPTHPTTRDRAPARARRAHRQHSPHTPSASPRPARAGVLEPRRPPRRPPLAHMRLFLRAPLLMATNPVLMGATERRAPQLLHCIK